jgi:hypothetical protein
MAKTYYKYAKRDTTPVDYAGAAQGLSDGLMATVTGLEKKAEKAAGEVAAAKSKIDEEFKKEEDRKRKEDQEIDAQYGEKLNKATGLPLSYQEDYKSIQSVILDLSSDAANWRAQLKRDLDSGKITTKEYNRKVNNISDQFKLIKQTGITSMDMITSTNEGIESGEVLPIQHDIMKSLLKARFDGPNADYKIDKDGNVYADIKDPDTGSVTKMSVYDLNKLSMQRFASFDIDAQSDSLVKDIGAVMENYRTAGKTTEDLLKMEIMQTGNVITTPMQYVDENINGYDNNKLSAILQMKMGKQYKRSTNPNDFGNDDIITYVVSPLSGQYEAKLTDNQIKEAKDFARAQVLAKLNPLKKPTPSTTRTAEDRVRSRNIETATADVNRLLEMFSGDADKKRQVLATYSDILNKKGNGFIEAKIEGDELVITREAFDKDKDKMVPTTERVPMPDDPIEFIKTVGPKLTGDQNILDLIDEATSGIDMTKVSKQSGDTSYKIEREEDLSQDLVDWADIATTISMPDSWYWTKSGKYGDVANMVSSYIDGSGIKGASSKIDGDNLVISVDGIGDVSVDLAGKSSKEIEVAVKGQLKVVHDAASTGKSISGSSDPLGLGI